MSSSNLQSLFIKIDGFVLICDCRKNTTKSKVRTTPRGLYFLPLGALAFLERVHRKNIFYLLLLLVINI